MHFERPSWVRQFEPVVAQQPWNDLVNFQECQVSANAQVTSAAELGW